MRECWHWGKFQWGSGLILCLIVVVGIAIWIAVGVSGGSGDNGEPSPSPLAQFLTTYLQEAFQFPQEAWSLVICVLLWLALLYLLSLSLLL
jgi:hypothetical protein